MNDLRRKDDTEMQDLKQVVCDLIDEVKNLSTAFENHQKKTDPMYEWFQNINFTKRTIIWVLGIVASIGGILLIIKELLK